MITVEIRLNSKLAAIVYARRMENLTSEQEVYPYECEVYEGGSTVNCFQLRHRFKDGYTALICAILKHDATIREDEDGLHGVDVEASTRVLGSLLSHLHLRPEPDETTNQKGMCSHWLELYEPASAHALTSMRMVHRRTEGYHSLVGKALMRSPNKFGRKRKKKDD